MRLLSPWMLLASASLLSISTARAQDVLLDTISVTTTKTEEKAIDSLGGVSVVGRREIDRFQPSRISDVFRDVPGVTSQENANDPAQSINIRGLQDFGRVNVMVDGARQNFQTSGHRANGVFYLDPEFIGTVDIARGPVSTIYGSGAIGGVVLFRTRGVDDLLAPNERYGVSQKIGAGTNGAGLWSSTMVGTRLGNNSADLVGQFVTRHTYNYQDGLGRVIPDTGSELVGGLAKMNVRPADGHEISATAMKQDYDFTNNGSTGNSARFADEVKTGTYTLGYRFQRRDVPLLDFNVKVYDTTTNNTQTFLRDSPSRVFSALGAKFGSKAHFDIDTKGFDAFNTSRFDVGPVAHALTYGIDGVQDHVKTDDSAGGFGAALTPSGERRLGGAFLQDELRYGGWLRVIGAARYDQYELNSAITNASGDHVSPKITVGVSPVVGIEFYGTYAEGYRAPAITETLIAGIHPFPAFVILPNPNLRPEVAHNIEGGVNIKFDNVARPGDKLRAKATVFSNKIDDFIDIDNASTSHLVIFIPGAPASLCNRIPGAFASGLCSFLPDLQYQNIARATINGVEFEGAYDFIDGFVSVAATHLEGRNAITNTTLVSVPPDRVSGTLGLRFLDGRLTAGFRLTGVEGKRLFPPDGTISSSKPYGLVDLFASYRHNEYVQADFTVQNLLDKRYQQYLNSDYSPGLVAKAAVTVKFASQ